MRMFFHASHGLLKTQTLARVVETTERHFKAAGRRSGLPLPPGPIEDRDYFRLWPKVLQTSVFARACPLTNQKDSCENNYMKITPMQLLSLGASHLANLIHAPILDVMPDVWLYCCAGARCGVHEEGRPP